jgi:hypothetical protein
MVEERGKGGLYTPRSLIRKLKVYARIDKKRNYKTAGVFLRSDSRQSREIFSPGQQANILDAAYPERNRSAWKEPRNTNIRRGIDSLAPARSAVRLSHLCRTAPAGSIHAAAQRSRNSNARYE